MRQFKLPVTRRVGVYPTRIWSYEFSLYRTPNAYITPIFKYNFGTYSKKTAIIVCDDGKILTHEIDPRSLKTVKLTYIYCGNDSLETLKQHGFNMNPVDDYNIYRCYINIWNPDSNNPNLKAIVKALSDAFI